MKIAVFYHCKISHSPLIKTSVALKIMNEQMGAIRVSGLLDAADEFHIGINGDDEDRQLARMVAPAKARIITHGADAVSEIPTMEMLREWLPGHEDWVVLYKHCKGVTHPDQMLYTHWRHCMQRALVGGWRLCVDHLSNGVESCGCHWMTPERFGPAVKSAYWGGTFWWAKASFLASLPPLPEATWTNRFEAENWIGRGPRRPTVVDFHPEWPGNGCAE